MQKSDYLYMILDNVLAFSIQLAPEYQGNGLNEHLDKFDENALKIVAGFNKNFLRHFLNQSKGKNPKDVEEELKKMEVISYIVGPIGNLNYLGEEQLDHVLDKLPSLKLEEIDEAKISLIADENLRLQFGRTGGGYSVSQALENQLTSAAFYLMNMGYSRQEIQEKFKGVRNDPAKLGELFNLPEKEIYNMPAELEQGSSSAMQPPSENTTVDQTPSVQEAIERHMQSIHEDITDERAQKVKVIMVEIKDHVREMMSELQEKIFLQMHPDRLRRAFKMLKSTKRKSKRMELFIEWFASSFLLSKIELKVEHWQVSSTAGHGDAGVFTAGIDFSRYDPIISDFSNAKLTKIINIARKILQRPTKKAIQKLGQDLISETGFDEHLYFTD